MHMTVELLFEDLMDFSLARRAMIDNQLRPQAVTDAGVLAAMGTVPREEYVPAEARPFAYFDRSIALDGGAAMMPPAALGRLLSELAPRAGERALVIGDASGYSAALLSAIGVTVTTDAGGGDLVDLLLIDGAVDMIPEALIARLVEGGRIGTALNDAGVTRLVVGRVSRGALGLRTIVDADVASLPGYERPPVFIF